MTSDDIFKTLIKNNDGMTYFKCLLIQVVGACIAHIYYEKLDYLPKVWLLRWLINSSENSFKKGSQKS